MTDSISSRMHWDDPDRPNAIKIFHQQCELYFSMKNVAPNKQVDHILFFAGATGLKLYNSWGLPDDEKKDPKTRQFGPNMRRSYTRKLISGWPDSISNDTCNKKMKVQTTSFRD